MLSSLITAHTAASNIQPIIRRQDNSTMYRYCTIRSFFILILKDTKVEQTKTNTNPTMAQGTMSAALIQAAQQIEDKLHSSDAGESKKRKELPGTTLIAPAPSQTASPSNAPGESSSSVFVPKAKKTAPDQSRATRLMQNRKAARESRRRKKAMVEELQRSLMFFSKSNAALKSQNEVLTRHLLDAHNALSTMGKPLPPLDPKTTETLVKSEAAAPPKVEAESKPVTDPAMQPGATMQAMASFQQAAQAAMEAASRTMKAHGVVVTSQEPTSTTSEV
jgi:hypothetical protein